MEYRSDVALCLSKEAHETFTQLLRGNHNNIDYQALLVDAITRNDDSGAVLYRWPCTVWSFKNKAVMLVENTFRKLKVTDYLFIRIGRDLDDTEYSGEFTSNPFCMTLQREINFDYDA